jgi:Tfp pilus assembly protein PilP
MYRKLFVLTPLAVLLLALSGCSKDAEINSTVADLHSFSEEIVSKIQSAPNPSAGVEEAQRLMDARKADLKARLQSLKDVRGFQVSEETKTKMTQTITADAMKVAGLQLKYVGESIKNPAFKAKLDKLTKDYAEIFTLQ